MQPAAPGPEVETTEVSAPGPGRGRMTATAVAAGGLLAAIGSLLPWVRVEVDLTTEGGGRSTQVFLGLESWHGWAVLLLGLALVGVGLGARAAPQIARRPLGFLTLLLAAGVVLFASLDLFHLQDDVLGRLAEDLAAGSDLSVAAADAMLRFLAEVEAGPGLYLILAGGWISAIAGAIAALAGRSSGVRPPSQPEEELLPPAVDYPGDGTGRPAGG